MLLECTCLVLDSDQDLDSPGDKSGDILNIQVTCTRAMMLLLLLLPPVHTGYCCLTLYALTDAVTLQWAAFEDQFGIYLITEYASKVWHCLPSFCIRKAESGSKTQLAMLATALSYPLWLFWDVSSCTSRS